MPISLSPNENYCDKKKLIICCHNILMHQQILAFSN